MTETAERRRGAARFEELARERWRLEQRADELAEGLRQTLDQLSQVDRDQRGLLWCVDNIDRQTARTRLAQLIQGWLGVKFGDGGYAPLLRDPKYDRPLSELDRLAKALTEQPTKGA